MDVPREFTTKRSEAGATVPIARRPNLEGGATEPLLRQVSAVEGGAVYHAYGPATDVPGQLAAVIVGDDETREEAWWNLWGNIHHQGTIYEATVPAVPILFGLAGWREHPDRAEAIRMLREIAAAPGVYVWRHGAKNDLVTVEDEQRRLYPELRSVLTAGAAPILEGWRTEPPNVQRALLWLLSADADIRAERQDLVDAVLPTRHRPAWELEISGSADTEEEEDAVVALEHWVHSGAD